MAGNAAEAGRSVVSRVMALLAAFDTDHRQLTATAVASRSGVPLSTAHRLLADLVATGALTRSGDHYAIGQRLWTLGLLAPVQTGLRDVAAPFLQDVFAATRATVHLAVRDGTEVLYLDRLSGRRSVPVVSKVGSRLPMHATGVGKVLLAWAPDDLRETVLAGDLVRVTPYTVTQAGRLREQLRRIRLQEHAVTSEEMSLGACSLAVPVRRDDRVVAALGLVVPSIGRDKPTLLAALEVAAHGIGRSLSWVDLPRPISR